MPMMIAILDGVDWAIIGYGALAVAILVGVALLIEWQLRTIREQAFQNQVNRDLPTDWENGYVPYLLPIRSRQDLERLPPIVRDGLETIIEAFGRTPMKHTFYVGIRPQEPHHFIATVEEDTGRYVIHYPHPDSVERAAAWREVLGLPPRQT